MTTIDLGLPKLGGLDRVPTTEDVQKAKDFASDQEVRWCPGCGDYAVLAAVRSFLPTLSIRRENTVFSRLIPRVGRKLRTAASTA